MTRFLRQLEPLPALGLLIGLGLLPCVSSGDEPEIYRCTQEDGTVAFQGMPCPDPASKREESGQTEDEASSSEEDPFDFVNPFDQVGEAVALSEPTPEAPISEDRAECVKTTRDAIDAIDMELGQGPSRDDDRQRLAELLELTRQLRACKEL